jgi:hypothetical protein
MRIGLMVEGQEDVTWTQWLALALAAEDSRGAFGTQARAPVM